MASDTNATARKKPLNTAAQSIQNSSDVMLFSHSINFLSIFFYLPSPDIRDQRNVAAMSSQRTKTKEKPSPRRK